MKGKQVILKESFDIHANDVVLVWNWIATSQATTQLASKLAPFTD